MLNFPRCLAGAALPATSRRRFSTARWGQAGGKEGRGEPWAEIGIPERLRLKILIFWSKENLIFGKILRDLDFDPSSAGWDTKCQLDSFWLFQRVGKPENTARKAADTIFYCHFFFLVEGWFAALFCCMVWCSYERSSTWRRMGRSDPNRSRSLAAQIHGGCWCWILGGFGRILRPLWKHMFHSWAPWKKRKKCMSLTKNRDIPRKTPRKVFSFRKGLSFSILLRVAPSDWSTRLEVSSKNLCFLLGRVWWTYQWCWQVFFLMS